MDPDSARRARVALPAGSLVTLLGALATAESGDRASIGDITAALGPAGLGGAILVPALIALSPATAIFAVATVSGLSIALSAQIMLERQKLWLPRWIFRLHVRRIAPEWISDKLPAPFRWLEERSVQRLTFLMRTPFGYVPGIVSFAIGLSLPFLELVPLSATTGGAALTFMVLGLLLDDGLLVLAGLLVSAAVAFLAFSIGSGLSGPIARRARRSRRRAPLGGHVFDSRGSRVRSIRWNGRTRPATGTPRLRYDHARRHGSITAIAGVERDAEAGARQRPASWFVPASVNEIPCSADRYGVPSGVR